MLFLPNPTQTQGNQSGDCLNNEQSHPSARFSDKLQTRKHLEGASQPPRHLEVDLYTLKNEVLALFENYEGDLQTHCRDKGGWAAGRRQSGSIQSSDLPGEEEAQRQGV